MQEQVSYANNIQHELIIFQIHPERIGYIGSELGSLQVTILLAICPEYEKYLAPIIMMPPGNFLGNSTSTLRFLTPLVPFFK